MDTGRAIPKLSQSIVVCSECCRVRNQGTYRALLAAGSRDGQVVVFRNARLIKGGVVSASSTEACTAELSCQPEPARQLIPAPVRARVKQAAR